MNRADVKAMVAKLDELGEQGNPVAAKWALAFAIAPQEKHEELAEAFVGDMRKVVEAGAALYRKLMDALPPSARAVLEASDEPHDQAPGGQR